MGANIYRTCKKLEQVGGVVDEICRQVTPTSEGFQDGVHGLNWCGRIVVEFDSKRSEFGVSTRFEK